MFFATTLAENNLVHQMYRVMHNKHTALCLLASLCLVSACKRKATTPVSQEPPSVPVVEVIQEDIPLQMTFVGQTYGSADITIQSRVSGFLTGIHFREGGPVKKGQLLYTVEPSSLSAQSAEANAALVNARTALTQAQANYDRIKPLAEMDAVSQSVLDASLAQLGSARASVRSAEASLRYANIQLGYTRIYSPVDGVIGPTNARIGDFVGLQSEIPVLNTVSQIDSVLVRFYMPYNDYLSILSRGENASLTVIVLTLTNGMPYPYRGRFDFVGRAVTQSSGSIEVQVSFQNPDSVLRPGQFAKITANMGTLRGALLVPQKSVSELQNLYTVYVVGSDNKLSQKVVEVGPTYGELWVITSGIAPGDRVVLEGFHKVRAGMEITPVMTAVAAFPQNSRTEQRYTERDGMRYSAPPPANARDAASYPSQPARSFRSEDPQAVRTPAPANSHK